jgi:hypothetical protein
MLTAAIVAVAFLVSTACASGRPLRCTAGGDLHVGMTREEVLGTTGFNWPILYARVLWMSSEPDAQGVYSARVQVGHPISADDPAAAWLYEIPKPSPANTLLVQFDGARVKEIRCVRLTR